MINILTIILGLYITSFILQLFICKRNNTFDIYFGVPGSGKTTLCAYLAKKYNKKYKKKGNKVYCNVDIKDTYCIEKTDIGYYDISNGLLLFDEVGIDFNNRNFKKNFTDEQLDFFKKHRHYNVDIAVFSQFWNDPDKKLRDLTTRIFLIKKSIIPFFISRRQIKKWVGINKETNQIEDQYKFVFLSRKLIFAPATWKSFNTHERIKLPHKDFKYRA